MEEVKRELLERVYAAQSHGSPEVLVEARHPDFEWIWPKGMADTDVFHGPEGLRRGIGARLEPWEECRLDPEEMLGRGAEILVIVRYQRVAAAAAWSSINASPTSGSSAAIGLPGSGCSATWRRRGAASWRSPRRCGSAPPPA